MFGTYVHVKAKEYVDNCYCMDCERWFDHPHTIEYDEPRGEYWGIPCSEHIVEWHCPYCNSESIYSKDDIVLDDEEDEEDEWYYRKQSYSKNHNSIHG